MQNIHVRCSKDLPQINGKLISVLHSHEIKHIVQCILLTEGEKIVNARCLPIMLPKYKRRMDGLDLIYLKPKVSIVLSMDIPNTNCLPCFF